MESAKEGIYMNQYRFYLVEFYLGFAMFLILTGGGCSTFKGLKHQNTGLLDTSKGLKHQNTGPFDTSKGLKRQIASLDVMDLDSIMPASLKFVQVKAGTFLMGSSLDEKYREDGEIPHKVTLTQDFEIQATEVTQRQYFLVMDFNPSFFNKKAQHCPNDHTVINEVSLCWNHPVEQVSWNDVQNFISRLNARSHDGYTYGLPTEAQWEYAARGCMGSGEPTAMASCTMTAFNLGDNISGAQVNHKGDFYYEKGPEEYRKHTVKVSSLPNANDLGLHDMHGNVREWVEDRYEEYSRSHVVDPKGSSSDPHRVQRGGGWNTISWHVRSASRDKWMQGSKAPSTGFRLVRTANK